VEFINAYRIFVGKPEEIVNCRHRSQEGLNVEMIGKKIWLESVGWIRIGSRCNDLSYFI
jgi:hypothetical protein